jgi:hypothetical protein
MRGLFSFQQQIVGFKPILFVRLPMLLRLLRDQKGESAITMAVTVGTLACMAWLILLLTEVDLRPGYAALSEMSEPWRQQVRDLTGL